VAPDVKQSLRIVWLVISLIVLATLAAPFALGRERLAHLFPVCEQRAKYGLECPFCGMTTSFLAISEGRIGEAGRANRAGIPLYLLFISNEVCALVFLRRKE
jgi:hypothetical protein